MVYFVRKLLRPFFNPAHGISPTNRFLKSSLNGIEALEHRRVLACGLEPIPGDSSQNGFFGQEDIVQVAQAGKYLTEERATWQQGDWNSDGVFNQLDIVAALKEGAYLENPECRLQISYGTPMTLLDPNRDPDWDWTLDQPYDLFVLTDAGPAMIENVKLPYYADRGPAAVDLNIGGSDICPAERDICPQEGWVLLYRDFGTDGHHVPFPHFILYNRYRGLLRVFYFTPSLPELLSYAVVTLRRQQRSDQGAALLTFTDETKATLSDYDPNRQEVFVGKIESRSWNYADFPVVGYDPELPDNFTFVLDIDGVRKSDVSLTGTATLDQVLEQANLGLSKAGLGQSLLTFGQSALFLFRAQDSLTKALEKLQKKPEDANGISEVFSAIEAGIGLFNVFLGLGGSEPKRPQLIKLRGNLDLAGNIETRLDLHSLFLRVPGARHGDDDYLPLYDKPLGVFNLRSKPIVDASRITLDRTDCAANREFPGAPQVVLSLEEHILRRPSVIINPKAGLTADVEVALVPPSGTPRYSSISEIQPVLVGSAARCPRNPPRAPQSKVAVKLTVVPETAPVPNNFTPVTIVKLYPAEYRFDL